MKQTVFSPRIAAGVVTLAGALFVAGCGSSGGPRDLMLEEANATPVERPVAMRGEGTFLEGKVVAQATVSRGFDRGPGGGGPGGKGGRRGHLFGKDDELGAFGEVYNLGGETEEEQKEAMMEYIRQAKARRAAGSPMPPVTLRVMFENKGTEPLEIEVKEVNSDLGNFAVRPPLLKLAPGEKGALNPMISQLGVTSDEIPLKLALRSGGKTEMQVVVVKNVIKDSLKKDFDRMQK